MVLGEHQAGQFYLDNWKFLEGSNTNRSNKEGSNGLDENRSNPDGSNENGFYPNGSNEDRLRMTGSSQEVNFGLKFHFKRNLTR